MRRLEAACFGFLAAVLGYHTLVLAWLSTCVFMVVKAIWTHGHLADSGWPIWVNVLGVLALPLGWGIYCGVLLFLHPEEYEERT